MKTEQLLAQIRDLPVEERAKIADAVLKTLNSPDPEIDARWMDEVERRAEEVESGDVEMIPGKEFEKRRKEKRNNE